MRIKSINPTTIQHKGWLKERFGECVAQISTDNKLKLRSATKDVFRAKFGQVPLAINKITAQFPDAPQGIEDHDFVFGYKNSEGGWTPGQIETDPALIAFSKNYPDEWSVIQKALGLSRSKGRHACLPAGEAIFVSGGIYPTVEIEQCQKMTIPTGQGATSRANVVDQGQREVWEYQMEDGRIFRCTQDHLLLVEPGVWMPAQIAFEQKMTLMEPK